MNKVIEFNKEELYLDSREVAEMMGKEHKEILQYLEGRKDKEGNVLIEGIIPVLESEGLHSQNYFIKSSYKVEGNNKNYPCYLCTKMGCEMLGNKQQGAKGILFTAKYVKRFNEMEEHLKNEQLLLANNKIKELTDTLEEFKRATEEAKQQYKPSHKKKLDYNRMIKMVTNNEEEVQVVKDWVFGILNISKWEDTCVSDSSKIMEVITAVVKLLSINKFQQLSLWDN